MLRRSVKITLLRLERGLGSRLYLWRTVVGHAGTRKIAFGRLCGTLQTEEHLVFANHGELAPGAFLDGVTTVFERIKFRSKRFITRPKLFIELPLRSQLLLKFREPVPTRAAGPHLPLQRCDPGRENQDEGSGDAHQPRIE